MIKITEREKKMGIHILINAETEEIIGCYFDLSKAEKKRAELKKLFPYRSYRIQDHWVE